MIKVKKNGSDINHDDDDDNDNKNHCNIINNSDGKGNRFFYI